MYHQFHLLFSDRPEFMTAEDKRELAFERSEWRRILPELSIPLRNMEVEDEEIIVLRNGKPEPFVHPDGIPSHDQPQRKKQQIPNLWPFRYKSLFHDCVVVESQINMHSILFSFQKHGKSE